MISKKDIYRGLRDPKKAINHFSENGIMPREITNHGVSGFKYYFPRLYYTIKNRNKNTFSIWSEDWDMLIVLDACRYDTMLNIKEKEIYEFVDNLQPVWSAGGHSKEWMLNTFNDNYQEEIQNTTYITGNHYNHIVEDLGFENLVDINKRSYSDDFPVPPAHVTTDIAIDVARNTQFNNLIVHYMQPHKPFISKGEERKDVDIKDWSLGWNMYEEYENGLKDRAEIINAYKENLVYVLDEVKILLDNVNAPKVAITADHGNAFGEDNIFDHHIGLNHQTVREVPWIKTSANDNNSVHPDTYNILEEDKSVEEQLKMLGYK